MAKWAPLASVQSVMQHTSVPTSSPQEPNPFSTREAVLKHTGSFRAAATGLEGVAQPSEEEDDAPDRDGLVNKLHRTLSSSLSRISGFPQAPNAYRRRKSSVGVAAMAAVEEASAGDCHAGASSAALDALMPFVPLMFRRDLLLPEPTFSATQVVCALCEASATHVVGLPACPSLFMNVFCKALDVRRPMHVNTYRFIRALARSYRVIATRPNEKRRCRRSAIGGSCMQMQMQQAFVMIADITGFTRRR